MKKLLFLLVALSLGTTASAGPCYWFSFDSGVWTEQFVNGNPGEPGNVFKITNGTAYFDVFGYTAFQLLAENQGAGPNTNPDPSYAGYEYATPYVGKLHFDSFFDVFFDVEVINYSHLTDSILGTGTFVLNGSGVDDGGQGYQIIIDYAFGDFVDFGATTESIMLGFGTVCVPAPGALLLGSLGVALVGTIRRRLA